MTSMSRPRLRAFWIWLAVAVLLTLVSVYFYRYQVPSPESIAPGGDRTDSDLRFAAWYAIIAAAGVGGVLAVVSLVRGLRRR